jgi:hypothetical protein
MCQIRDRGVKEVPLCCCEQFARLVADIAFNHWTFGEIPDPVDAATLAFALRRTTP